MEKTNNHELLMYLDDSINRSILDIMFIARNNDKKDYYVSYDDISLMNLMFIFLNKYVGKNIVKDFYSSFKDKKLNYSFDFYIYFIFTYYKMFESRYNFSREFVTNIKDLYYLEEVEFEYNPDKFKMHYGDAEFGKINISRDVNSSLINYINDNLPKTLQSDLEKAIGIYVLLTKALRYAPVYLATGDIYDTTPYYDVTLENNEAVCVNFSLIYHKILEKFGIESNLTGSVDSHMFVNLNFGTMMIRVDATKYGYSNEQYELSDLTNSKYGFPIEGIKIDEKNYMDPNCIPYAKDKLTKAIIDVYTKLGLSRDSKKKYIEFIDKYQRNEFTKPREVNKEVFDERISMVNEMVDFHSDSAEDVQFFSWLITSVFYDIADSRLENILLYRFNNGKIELSKLLVLYEEDETPYYYLINNGKLVNYNVDEVVDIILSDDWCFKNLIDIDALYLEDDNLIKKLSR